MSSAYYYSFVARMWNDKAPLSLGSSGNWNGSSNLGNICYWGSSSKPFLSSRARYWTAHSLRRPAMFDLIWDSSFGQIVRYVTKNNYVQYSEEQKGFQHPHYLQETEKQTQRIYLFLHQSMAAHLNIFRPGGGGCIGDEPNRATSYLAKSAHARKRAYSSHRAY